MKKILFIRHGESTGNAGEVTTFPEDIPLSLTGIGQSHDLTKRITSTPDLIVFSNYIRTHQTAEPLMNTFPSVPTEKWDSIHEFTYLNKARCANMNAKDRQPMVDEYWDRNDPYYNDGGNAESFIEFLRRVEFSIYKIKDRPENNINLFSHGNFILGLKILLELKIVPGSFSDLSNLMLEFRKRKDVDFPENASIFDASEIVKF